MVDKATVPCEVCSSGESYDERDDFPDDLYRAAKPGTNAFARGFRFRRVCGRCQIERPREVAVLVAREDMSPSPSLLPPRGEVIPLACAFVLLVAVAFPVGMFVRWWIATVVIVVGLCLVFLALYRQHRRLRRTA